MVDFWLKILTFSDFRLHVFLIFALIGNLISCRLRQMCGWTKLRKRFYILQFRMNRSVFSFLIWNGLIITIYPRHPARTIISENKGEKLFTNPCFYFFYSISFSSEIPFFLKRHFTSALGATPEQSLFLFDNDTIGAFLGYPFPFSISNILLLTSFIYMCVG